LDRKYCVFYVDNDELLRELIISKENNELTKRAIEIFLLMVDRISRTQSYKYEEDREDCMAFAIENICMQWKMFDSNKSDEVFAYFTSLIMNGLKQGWNKLYKEKYNVTIYNIF